MSSSPVVGAPRPAKILHTADCHLGGSSSGGEKIPFTRAMDLAISEDVDAVLITGDLFDHARVREDLLVWTAEQLDRLDRPVVLIPGNHDAFHETSVYHRFEPSTRCKQVFFISDHDGATVVVPGTDLVVWGKAMIEHEPAFRPLTEIPPRPADRWAIIAGHGLVMDSDEPTLRGSPIYPSDLGAVDWDYVALGHTHQHMHLAASPVPACYAGATAGSKGPVPGVLIVDFVPGVAADPRWVSLQA